VTRTTTLVSFSYLANILTVLPIIIIIIIIIIIAVAMTFLQPVHHRLNKAKKETQKPKHGRWGRVIRGSPAEPVTSSSPPFMLLNVHFMTLRDSLYQYVSRTFEEGVITPGGKEGSG